MRQVNFLLVILIILFFASLPVRAEDKFARNALSFELAGKGWLYSVNYEYALTRNMGIGAGFSYQPDYFFLTDTKDILMFPVGLTFSEGWESHSLFLTVGLNVLNADTDEGHFFGANDGGPGAYRTRAWGFYPYAALGYEYRSEEPGFFMRVGAHFSTIIDGLPWPGIAVGMVF
jgi:hypothetical protein